MADIEKETVPINKSECCGCGICIKICRFGAISMTRDDEGFEYPVVDKEKCKNCGICIKKCSFYNCKNKKNDGEIKSAYILKHKNENVRMNSRSGGAFVALSEKILEDNGTVYGCIINTENNVLHIRANNKEDRNLMCKSKYAQSNIFNILDAVLEDLENGRKVLFTGTGCQVQAIIDFVSYKDIKLLNNLYTIDFVCHGVVSPLIFEEYVKWLQEKYNGKIYKFDFRDKNILGWEDHVESFYVKDKKHINVIYKNIFNSSLATRPSCYNCKFTRVNRASNLTIGDAWGIKDACSEFFDNKGASLIIVQDLKGKEMLEGILNVCDIVEVPIEKMLQPNLKNPTQCPNNREQFWKLYREAGFKKIVKKYGELKFYKKVKFKLKVLLKKIHKAI